MLQHPYRRHPCSVGSLSQWCIWSWDLWTKCSHLGDVGLHCHGPAPHSVHCFAPLLQQEINYSLSHILWHLSSYVSLHSRVGGAGAGLRHGKISEAETSAEQQVVCLGGNWWFGGWEGRGVEGGHNRSNGCMVVTTGAETDHSHHGKTCVSIWWRETFVYVSSSRLTQHVEHGENQIRASIKADTSWKLYPLSPVCGNKVLLCFTMCSNVFPAAIFAISLSLIRDTLSQLTILIYTAMIFA